MTSEQIAQWLVMQLANTGAWFSPVSTQSDHASFEIDMPDGVTSVEVTVKARDHR